MADDEIYNKLTDEEKQLCDVCGDWSFRNCNECEFVVRHKIIAQEDNFIGKSS